jgi:ubiquinone/menaquinone biosynthesis C-methylase UbiE
MVKRVDYDAVASRYDARYEQQDFTGVQRAVVAFAAAPSAAVLEVGCGTGHWLATLLGFQVATVVGVDSSFRMLERACATAPRALLARASAEALPWRDASFDRVLCVNALHHFPDPQGFLAEARRVLRSGGGLLTIGLDPHTGGDRWWVYDYFPSALAADRARYLPAGKIRQLMQEAGFLDCETREAQHIPAALPTRVAAARGLLDRRSTSQLMVISDGEYEAGVERIRMAQPRAGEQEPMLRADLRLYATSGWVPPGVSESR